jgi:2OG-Fe(II) oxygenase superfamily
MIQLTKRGLVFTSVEADLALLRRQFESQHCIHLKGFLDSELVSSVLPAIERANYQPKEYDHVGSELLMETNTALLALSHVANDPRLFELVQSVAGCGPINHFLGRIYKLVPAPLHEFGWHDDRRDPHRLIAMSINLGAEAYRGGLLQVREAGTGKVLAEVHNTGIGDAVLFRISRDLEHRVGSLQEGSAPRISFAGWFRLEPDEPTFHLQLQTAIPIGHP